MELFLSCTRIAVAEFIATKYPLRTAEHHDNKKKTIDNLLCLCRNDIRKTCQLWQV